MIYNFKEGFIQSLQDKYSFRGNSQVLNNPRYYVSGIKINTEDIYICIPLHSNGKYFLEIDKPITSAASSHWKNHGLNFEKILLLTSEEFNTFNDGLSWIQNNVINDIKRKSEKINTECLNYLKKYLNAYTKKNENKYVSREEQNILNFSSLNSFKDKVDLLLDMDLETLTLQDMGNISMDQELTQLEKFEKAYNDFIGEEYGQEEEDLSNKEIVGILYTDELNDSYEFLDYQLQIDYDLKNGKEVTNYESIYTSFTHKENSSLEQATENLNASFDDWLNAVPLDRDMLSQYTALYCIGVDEVTLNEKFNLNDLEIDFNITDSEKDILISNISEEMKADIEETMNIPFDEIIKQYKTIEDKEKTDSEKLLDSFSKRNKYKEYLTDLLKDEDNEEMRYDGNLSHAIYMIDGIVVGGGFYDEQRTVDHYALLSKDYSTDETYFIHNGEKIPLELTELIEWGTFIVPETETYISNEIIEDLEEIGYTALPHESNHIVGYKDTSLEIDKFNEIDTESKEYLEKDEKKLLESVNETEYKALIEFSKAHYEDIVISDDEIIFIPDNEDMYYLTKTYTSYKDLFMNEYKDRFIDEIETLSPEEILKENNNDLLSRLALTDPNLERAIKNFQERNKDIDLDNDGVPDRIDIDDNRNEVQTVDDIDKIEKNRTKPKKDKGMEL